MRKLFLSIVICFIALPFQTDAQIQLSPDGYNADQIVEYKNGILFFAHTQGGPWTLWKSDGTPEGTIQLYTLQGTGAVSPPRDLYVIGDYLFFNIMDEAHGQELWRSDGTPDGTQLLKDINPGPAHGIIAEAHPFKGHLYFSADDGIHGRELWRSDGTPEGTTLFYDLVPGAYSSHPAYMYNYDGTLIFYIASGVQRGLWKSDGTFEGTTWITNIRLRPPGLVSYPGAFYQADYFTNLDGTLFFVAQLGSSSFLEYELWKTNGTAEGTSLVKDIFSISSSDPAELTAFKGQLYFSARNAHQGRELWVSDGTETGTHLFKEFVPGWGDSNPEQLVTSEENLFFRAIDNTHGQELWKSDGTVEGTQLVLDINSGYSFSYPRNLTMIQETLFFQAYDQVFGYELWKSDGTPAGTSLVFDQHPGIGGSYPDDLTQVGQELFYTANNGVDRPVWKHTTCAISKINVLEQSDCYPIYNTYSQDLEITFTNAPAEGQIIVNGQAFPIVESPQLITLRDLSSDGEPVNIFAYFEETPSCIYTAPTLFNAPSSCYTPLEILTSMQGHLQDLVDASLLGPSANGLGPQLQQVINKINQGRIQAAINQLQGFILHVQYMKQVGMLSPEDAQVLLDGANAVLDMLNTTTFMQRSAPIASMSRHVLGQNYPNPVSDRTLIPIHIDGTTEVRLDIYDISGILIQTLVNETLPLGYYQVEFVPHNLPSGIYFYRLQTDKIQQSKKMIIE